LRVGPSMSDEINGVDSSAPVDAPAGDQAPNSFGARLKWERERSGLSVTDVAARLRLHPRQVRALEQESLGALPEAAYVRGFVRSYARVLNVDEGPLISDLSEKLAPSAASVVDGIAQQRDYSPVRAAARDQASRRVVVVGAVLLLVGLGLLGWYATRERAPVVGSGTVVPAAPVAKDIAPPEPAPAATIAPTVLATPADTPAVMEPVPPPPLLKLRFSGPSWAEVKDAEGKVLHSQHNTAGDEFVVEGTPPFYVVIGDTANSSVEVRGESYDLAPYTHQNVARFTIN
jgi:cytoskeleton protein RodZ